MPILKHILIHNTVNKSLKYALDLEKTDDGVLTASLNCMTNPQDAYLQMKMVYEHHTGHRFDEPIPEEGNAHVKAIHYVQSFSPDDNVTPELAHKIAKIFVRKAFGDNVQAVIATHTDKEHLHSHIIINAVDIEGKHFYANKDSLQKLRYVSDEVSKVFGIYPSENITGKGRAVAYNEWQYKKQGTSWKEQIRTEIDRLIPFAKSLDDLLEMLEEKRYTIKRGKYISIKAPGQQRAIRSKNLGYEYTEESLKIRIQYRDMGAGFSLNSYTDSELYRNYAEVLHDTRVLAIEKRKVEKRYNPNVPYSENNDLDVYHLSAILSVINQHKISSIGELQGKIQRFESDMKNAEIETYQIIAKVEQMDNIIDQAEIYFELLDKSELTESEELKLNLIGKTIQNMQIESYDDVQSLVKKHVKNYQRLDALRDSLEKNQALLNVYHDIADTYDSISKGDYISRLVEEKRREDEEKQKKKSPRKKHRR